MKPTLNSLLTWAHKKGLYIEIYGCGEALLEYEDENGNFVPLCGEKTLYDTLIRAKEILPKGYQPYLSRKASKEKISMNL